MKFEEMTGPQLVNAYNEMAEKLAAKPVSKFKTVKVGIDRCSRLASKLEGEASPPEVETSPPEGETSPEIEEPKKKRKPPKKPAKPRERSPRPSHAVSIEVIEQTPRREGTMGAKRYAEMVAWTKANPNGVIADLFADTSYRPNEFKWDVAHNHIRVKP